MSTLRATPRIDDIADAIERGERIGEEEALRLMAHPDVTELALHVWHLLEDEVRRGLSIRA